MNADKKRWYPCSEAISSKGDERRCQTDMASGRKSGKELPDFSQAILTRSHRLVFTHTAHWFAHSKAHHQSHHEAREADDKECHPPAERIIDPSTQPISESHADWDSTRI